MEQSGKKRRNCTNSGTPIFVDKLDNILKSPQYENIISWSKDGRSFVIKNVSAFIETVLPTFFKHRNLSSFIRQLNMYNFSKIRSDEGDHAYANELFIRDHEELYSNIKRRVTNEQPEQEGQLALKDSSKPIISKAYTKELQEIAGKQRDMEVVCMKLFRQNQNMISENAKMWRKITKRLEKKDRRVEKLLYFLLVGNNQALLENGIQSSSLQAARPNNLVFDYDNDGGSSESEVSYEPESEVQEHETLKTQPKLNANIMNLMSLLDKKSSNKLMRMLMEDNKNGTSLKKKKPTFTIVDQQNNGGAFPASNPELPLSKNIENLCIKENGQSKSNSPKNSEMQPEMDQHNNPVHNPLDSSIISDVNLFLNTEGEQQHDSSEWFKLQEP